MKTEFEWSRDAFSRSQQGLLSPEVLASLFLQATADARRMALKEAYDEVKHADHLGRALDKLSAMLDAADPVAHVLP